MNIFLEKFVNGGQTLGTQENGKKIFVWGGLPGETVNVNITNKKAHYDEGVVKEVISESQHRTTPLDLDSYLSTSPWQILNFEYENISKQELVKNTLNDFKIYDINVGPTKTDGAQYFYRNKYNFILSENSYDFSVLKRNSNIRQSVKSISLPQKNLTDNVYKIIEILKKFSIKPNTVQNILTRCSNGGKTISRVYLKTSNINVKVMENIEFVYFDALDPKQNNILYKSLKPLELQDKIGKNTYKYSIDSFWQVNQKVYKITLNDICKYISKSDSVVDFYAGVGSIGNTVSENGVFVESDKNSYKYLKSNISDKQKAVHTSTANALKYIKKNKTIIFDPPRAGLNKRIIEQLISVKPKKIVYLSCNPVTQTRDIKPLLKYYKILLCQPYNFFPKTPHIENLIILEKF